MIYQCFHFLKHDLTWNWLNIPVKLNMSTHGTHVYYWIKMHFCINIYKYIYESLLYIFFIWSVLNYKTKSHKANGNKRDINLLRADGIWKSSDRWASHSVVRLLFRTKHYVFVMFGHWKQHGTFYLFPKVLTVKRANIDALPYV